MKLRYSGLLLLSWFTLHAQWDAQIAYEVKVPTTSQWGIGSLSIINNNKGVAGVMTGVVPDIVMCPSMAYGVKPWVAQAVTTTVCQEDKKQQLEKERASGVKNATRCDVVTSTSGQLFDMSAVFTRIKEFVQTIKQKAQGLVDAFPDPAQGEGYASSAYLAFCKNPSYMLSKQLSLVERSMQGVGSNGYAQYFIGQRFVVVLDMTELIPSAQAQSEAQNWFAKTVAFVKEPVREAGIAQKIDMLPW